MSIVSENLEETSPEVAKRRIARLLRSSILEGKLRLGEALPSERKLSEQLGVGRTVVRQALAELDGEGLLARRGPRLRTVAFDRGDDHPDWLRKSVVLLTPPRLTGGPVAQRTRWLQYTTLGIMDHLRDREIHALNLSVNGIKVDEIGRLARSKPMGVLIPEVAGGESEVVAWAEMFRASGVPVVSYGGSPMMSGFDRVVSSHDLGSYRLTKAVIARGCKRIVQFWPRPWDHYWFKARNAGYTRAMTEGGLHPFPIYEFPYTPAPIDQRDKFDYVMKSVAGFMLEVLRTAKPDALLLATDRDVPYVAAALELHGLTAGKDVLLGGYDNYWQHCEERMFSPKPPAFTVDKVNQAAGSEMVQLLFDRIESKVPAERQTRVLEQNLIEFGAMEFSQVGFNSPELK